jgi:hypothetical protein
MQVIEQLRALEEAHFHNIYETLSEKGFGPLDGEVAKALRFRPQAIKKLPMVQRSKRAKMILEQTANAELTYELFGTYLMSSNKELITDFLDGTGVEHDEGMIENLEDCKPDPAKLDSTLTDLDGKYAPADVTLYMAMAAEQWGNVPEVEAAWRNRL